jgi:hypothetical protein
MGRSLAPTRGYASLSFLHSAATTIAAQGKPAFLYDLGDYDPSGMDVPRAVLGEVHRLAPQADITFTRLAVDEEQIEARRLPTKQSDARAATFGSRTSVEFDAIPAPVLRQIVNKAISSHIDPEQLQSLFDVEHLERSRWHRSVSSFGVPA